MSNKTRLYRTIPRDRIGDFLREDHRRLDALFEEVSDAAQAGVDNRTLGELWSRFTSGLLAHLRAEEELLFSRLAGAHPEPVRQLLAEHERIRALLAELDVQVDLHLLRAPTVQALIALLRAHARAEDETAYRWADEELAGSEEYPLSERILARLDPSHPNPWRGEVELPGLEG